jgi:segregation and condensation protein B
MDATGVNKQLDDMITIMVQGFSRGAGASDSGQAATNAFEQMMKRFIAYKQPISRMQVTAIRGVNVDATVKTLLTRGYVEEIGRDDGPGNAVLYGTTKMFLEKVGVDGVHELPPLSEFIPGPEIVEVLERGLRVDLVAEAQAPVGVAAEVAAAQADADTESA